MECEAAHRTNLVGHKSRGVADRAELLALKAEDFDELLGGTASNNGCVPVDGQGS